MVIKYGNHCWRNYLSFMVLVNDVINSQNQKLTDYTDLHLVALQLQRQHTSIIDIIRCLS